MAVCCAKIMSCRLKLVFEVRSVILLEIDSAEVTNVPHPAITSYAAQFSISCLWCTFPSNLGTVKYLSVHACGFFWGILEASAKSQTFQ